MINVNTNRLQHPEIEHEGRAALDLIGDPDVWFEQKCEQYMQKYRDNKIPSMAAVVSEDGLDWAYPPFILTSSAAALVLPLSYQQQKMLT